jgi:heme-degrading monooxygenase HmoA
MYDKGMIIVHDVFICKPGNASKAAKMFKEAMAKSPQVINIMTDMTGQYHRVIMVSQYKSLAAYEKSLEAHMNPLREMKEAMKKMEGFQDMYLTGSREIYRMW